MLLINKHNAMDNMEMCLLMSSVFLLFLLLIKVLAIRLLVIWRPKWPHITHVIDSAKEPHFVARYDLVSVIGNLPTFICQLGADQKKTPATLISRSYLFTRPVRPGKELHYQIVILRQSNRPSLQAQNYQIRTWQDKVSNLNSMNWNGWSVISNPIQIWFDSILILDKTFSYSDGFYYTPVFIHISYLQNYTFKLFYLQPNARWRSLHW